MPAPPDGGGAQDCASGHWVAAWQAPPTDASPNPEDASLNQPAFGPMQTIRSIVSPLGGGCVVRLRLSNRFGAAPVSFSGVRLARRTSGAAIDPASAVPVSFAGQSGLVIPAGAEAVSDPVRFTVNAFDDVAVSLAATDPGAAPTRHYIARQWSYATMPGAGDHAADAVDTAFTQAMTMRPFVTGLDVIAPAGTAAVVALGDSITDGFQGPTTTLPEDTATLDRNERYPDALKRRINAAGLALTVANAGISGNRVGEDGARPEFAPSALSRANADVLAEAGVRTVILSEGLNDLAFYPGVSAEQLEQSYVQLISLLHAAGLRVVQATLTPTAKAGAGFSDATVLAARSQVNAWIRGASPADAIADFDAAVRDAANPDAVAAAYDGGDGLHLNAAGYARLAQAIDLNSL